MSEFNAYIVEFARGRTVYGNAHVSDDDLILPERYDLNTYRQISPEQPARRNHSS